jgi:serine phosphatase RsbU (regulator of sigma subunit)
MSSAGRADARISSWVARIASVPARAALAIATAAVLALGVADVYFDPQLSFLILYMFPVLFATWNAGRAGGVAISLLSGLAWMADEIIVGREYAMVVIPVWNTLARAAVLIALVWVIAALKNAVESRFHAERQKFRLELELAGEIQRQLLPATLPAHGEVEVSAASRPMSTVGGDYYDFVELSDGRLAIVIADASGHGIGAALTMARLHGLLQSEAANLSSDLALLATRVNKLMHRGPDTRQYATLFFGIWDCARDQIEWVSGGHLPQLLVSGDHGGAVWLESTGPPLGLLPEATYRTRTIEVHPGDVVLLFTDGLVEAVNSEGEELGFERLANCVLSSRRGSLNDVRNALLRAFEEHVAIGGSTDDVTMILARRR